MSLRHAPLLYVFYETSRIREERQLFESIIGVPVIEVEPHLPHHRHGVFKYDGGGIILSHNMTGPSRFVDDESDGLVMVFGVPASFSFPTLYREGHATERRHGVATDDEGHHYRFVPQESLARTIATELQLIATDLNESIVFYRDVLDLELVERTDVTACFATGSVPLRLIAGTTAIDGRRLRHETYLIVFHTPDIDQTREELVARGLEFKSPRVGFSEIGGTIRFDDPTGNRCCLYVPSEESLTWGSGPKVIAIAGASGAAR
ncbi:MAG TPA: VOC family protein [Gemmatimonadaceae bacterium]|jgi:predicted enzyme related to lactoylglutathione lyase|nr:VOC family protein [Gemmatimonadaceae bacterium]